MTTLVIAEHDNASLKGATFNTVAAALKIGGDVHVLVAGHEAGAAAQAAAQIPGVAQVLHAEALGCAHDCRHVVRVGDVFQDEVEAPTPLRKHLVQPDHTRSRCKLAKGVGDELPILWRCLVQQQPSPFHRADCARDLARGRS